MKITITGLENVNKVGMTKAFQKNIGMGLKEAKNLTDRFLEDGLLEMILEGTETAEKLIEDLRSTNAHVSTDSQESV